MEEKKNVIEIENFINQAVTDYVEKRVGIGDFLEKIQEFEDRTSDLYRARKKHVAALIDIVIDNLDFEMHLDTYNPRDPNTTEKYIDWYYKKYIKRT